MKINILQRGAAKLFLKAKESQYINASDKEIVEALERLFIIELPKMEIPSPPKIGAHDFDGKLADFKIKINAYDEGEATDYEVIKILRMMFVFFLLTAIIRLVEATLGGNDVYSISSLYSMVATFFFGMLFIMLHFETNNQSMILLFLAYASLVFSLW